MQNMHNTLETIVNTIVEILCSENAKSALISQPYALAAIKVNIRLLIALLLASIAFLVWIAIAATIPIFVGIVIFSLPKILIILIGILFAFFTLIFVKSFRSSFQAKVTDISFEESNPLSLKESFSLEEKPFPEEEEAVCLLNRQTIEQLRNLIVQLNSSGGEIKMSPHNNKSQLIKKILKHKQGSNK